MEYLKAFLCGGALCLIGQILIDKTGLTPARILTTYVVAGVVLSALGLYQPLVDWAGAGATVPLTGFGHSLAKGVREAVAAGRPHRRTHRHRRGDRRGHRAGHPGGPAVPGPAERKMSMDAGELPFSGAFFLSSLKSTKNSDIFQESSGYSSFGLVY